MLHRRGFLTGMFSAFAAPAIVRASSLMPVKSMADWPHHVVWLDPLIIHPNPGPVMMELLKVRIDAAQKAMVRALADNLYEDYSPSPLDSWA